MGLVKRTMGKPDKFTNINPERKPSVQLKIKFELADVKDRSVNYSPPWGSTTQGLCHR
jgi:hypothetical protein